MGFLIIFIVLCMLIGWIATSIDDAVYSKIDQTSEDNKEAIDRKRMYNAIGHSIVRNMFRK